jgi:hypothetical protein
MESAEEHSYLQADGDPVRAQRRRRAAQEFPLWLHSVDQGELPISQQLVDTGASVQTAVINELQIDPDTWNRLCDVPPTAITSCPDADDINIAWVAELLHALGPHCPPVPPDAYAYLHAIMRFLIPPQRWHMALATAQAIGWHARRWGWSSVETVLLDRHEASIERPPYASFAWALMQLLEGANRDRLTALDKVTVVERSQRALCSLFAGCDLFELGAHASAWKAFVIRGGLQPGVEPMPPMLIEWVTLAGGQVIACQLDTPEKLAAAHRPNLWPSVESYQAVAFELSTDIPLVDPLVVKLRPDSDGGWRHEPIERFTAPEMRLTVIELQEALAKALQMAPEPLANRYRQAALRRERYAPSGNFYQRLDLATPDELETVGTWFPNTGGDCAVSRLRNAWPGERIDQQTGETHAD